MNGCGVLEERASLERLGGTGGELALNGWGVLEEGLGTAAIGSVGVVCKKQSYCRFVFLTAQVGGRVWTMNL